jgi:hypothetical protein
MPKPRNERIPIVRIKKGDNRKTIYTKVRKAFTAEDLARYCQVEEGIRAEQMLAELETIRRDERRKRLKRQRRA